jgi:hypothetical protein
MKTILLQLLAILALTSAGVSADYLTKDSGQVIPIPDGYNACEYDKMYNAKGYDPETGEFPAKPFADAFLKYLKAQNDKVEACAAGENFPTYDECHGLVISPNIRDVRCKVYDS